MISMLMCRDDGNKFLVGKKEGRKEGNVLFNDALKW